MHSYDLHAVLEKVPFIHVSSITSWTKLYTRSGLYDPIKEEKYNLAALASHKFIDGLLTKNNFKEENIPEGHKLKLDVYMFTYEELLLQLQHAYDLGVLRQTSLNIKLGE